MASADCRPQGYTACTLNVKRQTEEGIWSKPTVPAIISVISFVIFIFLCIYAYKHRYDPKDPKVNNDIELGVAPQQMPEPAVPEPVAIPGRRRSISTAPPPYSAPRFNSAKEVPGMDGMENIDLKK